MSAAPSRPPPTIIVGMAAEARIARRLACPVVIGGGTAAGAETAVAAAVGDGASGLVSFGLAGGLSPALRPGAVLIPAAVLTRGERFACDPALAARFGAGDAAAILGVDTVVMTAAEKRRLWQQTGALAADLESGAVARAAHAHGLAFAVLRVVCDPADRDLPPAALAALDRAGLIGVGRVIASLLRQPSQVPALLALARDAARAHQALRRSASRYPLSASAAAGGGD
jgi:adenosylhomocysteine nucleosidase